MKKVDFGPLALGRLLHGLQILLLVIPAVNYWAVIIRPLRGLLRRQQIDLPMLDTTDILKPLLKGLKIAPFVECSHCRALSELGTQQCKNCGAEITSTEDPQIYLVVWNMGARYTPFVECPNCRKLMKVGVRRCAECSEEIPEAYALKSAMAIVANTVACDVANSIRGYDSFAVLAIIGSIAIYPLDLWISGSPAFFYFVLFWSVMPLMTTLLWFYRFGRFSLGDAEYLDAKRHMRRTLTIWLAITSAQLIALGTWWV
ncbi:MAG: hypothetical protein QOD75_4001 [Blastocatellia bacterium]|jgi:RNA polymerase subunit RPABC4/transcription elongation factor Spt4|nr:hypothetical protein [Blastocatellia bacterium]